MITFFLLLRASWLKFLITTIFSVRGIDLLEVRTGHCNSSNKYSLKQLIKEKKDALELHNVWSLKT